MTDQDHAKIVREGARKTYDWFVLGSLLGLMKTQGVSLWCCILLGVMGAAIIVLKEPTP